MSLNTNAIVQVTMLGRYHGNRIVNSFHYRYEGASVPLNNYPAAMNNLATEFRTKVWTTAGPISFGLRQMHMPNYRLERIRVQAVFPQRVYYVDLPVNEAGARVLGGSDLPANVGIGFRLATNRAFRGATGNKRFSGQGSSGLVQGSDTWTDDWQIEANAYAVNISTRLLGTSGQPDFVPVIWSRRRPSEAGEIRTVVVNPYPRTQHSRTFLVGE